MARPRKKGEFFAWSDLYFGGDAEEIELPSTGGRVTRQVITRRNIIRRGEPVSQSDLGCTDEEWEHLVESGSIRPYAVPDGADDQTSPTRAILAQVTDPSTGEVDPNLLMELALKHPPPMNPPAEEEAEVPVGT